MRKIRKFKDAVFIYTLLAMLLPAILIYSVTAKIGGDHIKSDIKKNNITIAKEIQGEATDYFQGASEIINQVDQMFQADNKTGIAKNPEYIGALLKNNKYIQYLEITDRNNVILDSYPEDSNGIKIDGFNKLHDLEIEDLAKQNSTSYFPAYTSRKTGEKTALMVVQREYRVYKAYLNLNNIDNITKNPSIKSKTMRAYLEDTQGNIVSSNIRDFFEKDKNIELISKNVEKNTLVFEGDYFNQKNLISAVKIPNIGWYSVVIENKDSAYFQLTTLNVLLGAIIFLSVFIINICFDFFVKRVNTIYRRFIDSIIKIIEGDYHSNIEIDSFEEINELSNHFNKMIGAVNHRENKIKRMAFSDQLTELPNRKFFLEKLDKLLGQTSDRVVIVFLDIDNFKQINDAFGHCFGDEMLIQVTERLKKAIKTEDLLARFGGDEFLILLKDSGEKAAVEQWLHLLKELLKLPFKTEDMMVDIRFSAGIACYPQDGNNSTELLKNAEIAMYNAKSEAKNSYKFFREEMNLEVSNFVKIEQAMKKAIEEKEFQLYYQPQINLKENKLRGFEALIRCNSSELGYILPVEFIPTLEKTGMIMEVGKWILEEACDKINELSSKNIQVIISVNVSSIQLMSKNFYEMVKNIVIEKNINTNFLELEITETVLIKSYSDILQTLNKIKALGIKLSIDDFGTGYSSLSYIRTLPVDTVKIDKSFINGLVTEKEDKNLTDIILLMAQKLKLTVVAEGVENLEQLQYLKNNNCDHAQGYYFGKPMNVTQMDEFIEEQFNEKLELLN